MSNARPSTSPTPLPRAALGGRVPACLRRVALTRRVLPPRLDARRRRRRRSLGFGDLSADDVQVRETTPRPPERGQ